MGPLYLRAAAALLLLRVHLHRVSAKPLRRGKTAAVFGGKHRLPEDLPEQSDARFVLPAPKQAIQLQWHRLSLYMAQYARASLHREKCLKSLPGSLRRFAPWSGSHSDLRLSLGASD